MVIDESSPLPWGDLNLVAGGIVPLPEGQTLAYDFGLISDIGNSYTNFILDPDIWTGVQYEFDIYGNDPLISSVPLPAAIWLFGSGLVGLIWGSRESNDIIIVNEVRYDVFNYIEFFYNPNRPHGNNDGKPD